MDISLHAPINTKGINLTKAGLPWLLKQPVVMDRLGELARISLCQRESAFSVLGNIGISDGVRSISVSPVNIGSIASVFRAEFLTDEGLIVDNAYTSRILDIHAHPYQRNAISYFSPSDLTPFNSIIEAQKGLFEPAVIRANMSRFSVGLLQVVDKMPGLKNQVELLLLQAGRKFDPLSLISYRGMFGSDACAKYMDMGFKVLSYSFPFASLGDPEVFSCPAREEGTKNSNFKIWYSKKAEGVIKHFAGSMHKIYLETVKMQQAFDKAREDDKKARLVENGGTLENSLLFPAMDGRLKNEGLSELKDILLRMGFSGPVVKVISSSFAAAANEGKIKPDFHFTVKWDVYGLVDDPELDELPNREEKVLYFRPENELLRELAPFSGLVFEGEAARLYLVFRQKDSSAMIANLGLTRYVKTVIGPDGRQLRFLAPELFEDNEFLKLENKQRRRLAAADAFIKSLIDRKR